MGTNGVLSITDHNGQVKFKIVAGVDGGLAVKLAQAIKDRIENGSWRETALGVESLYNLAIVIGFGSVACLTVVSKDEIIYCGDDECPQPDSLYRTTFECAYFNPRWGCGIAGSIAMLRLATLEIRVFNPEWSATF